MIIEYKPNKKKFFSVDEAFRWFCRTRHRCNFCMIFDESDTSDCLHYFQEHYEDLGFCEAKNDTIWTEKEIAIVNAIHVLVPGRKNIRFIQDSRFEETQILCGECIYSVVSKKDCPNFYKLDKLNIEEILEENIGR